MHRRAQRQVKRSTGVPLCVRTHCFQRRHVPHRGTNSRILSVGLNCRCKPGSGSQTPPGPGWSHTSSCSDPPAPLHPFRSLLQTRPPPGPSPSFSLGAAHEEDRPAARLQATVSRPLTTPARCPRPPEPRPFLACFSSGQRLLRTRSESGGGQQGVPSQRVPRGGGNTWWGQTQGRAARTRPRAAEVAAALPATPGAGRRRGGGLPPLSLQEEPRPRTAGLQDCGQYVCVGLGTQAGTLGGSHPQTGPWSHPAGPVAAASERGGAGLGGRTPAEAPGRICRGG